jgi:hypothetical protein
MILVHRITPFFIGLSIALGFVMSTVLKWHPAVGFFTAVVATGLLLARLVGGSPRHFQFWYFLGTPLLFVVSSFGVLLFLEQRPEQALLAVVTSLLVFFFAEQLFSYLHTPANYQAYSIEHFSVGLNVLTIFFFSATAFGLRLFLLLPLPMLAACFFLAMFYLIFGTLWVSKVEMRHGLAYAGAGAVLATELFSVLAFLPTGFYTNAALLTLFTYLFLGLTRARFLDQLTKPVVRRYLVIGSGLFAAIIGTARWV